MPKNRDYEPRDQIQLVVRRLGDGTSISAWSYEPREGLVVYIAKALPSSRSYFKTLSIGLVRGIGLPTSCSAGRRAMADSRSSATVKYKNKILFVFTGC